MAIAIACSKIWDQNLVSRLSSKLNTEVFLITEKEKLTVEYLKYIGVEKIFFPHWSYLIKPKIFENFECIIFHMTDLPYGRGGSPLQGLIIRGKTETKISAFRCSLGIDTGPVYLKKTLSLEGRAQDIFVRASSIIEMMILEIELTNPQPQEQFGEIVNFERRKPEDGNLADLREPETIFDYIRMLDAEGYPNAFLEQGGILYEFHSANWVNGKLEAKVRIKLK